MAYPTVVESDVQRDLLHRKMLCIYLLVCTNLLASRDESDSERQVLSFFVRISYSLTRKISCKLSVNAP